MRIVLAIPAAVAIVVLVGCGPDGVTPGTVEPGQDFSIAEVVYDENYFYCVVEPMLFEQRCGDGDPGQGDAPGSCHFSISSYRISNYDPLVGTNCTGIIPNGLIPPQARTNYGASQAKMQLDPELAPLLNRPAGKAAHPRKIFELKSPPADVIRTWATKYSTQ